MKKIIIGIVAVVLIVVGISYFSKNSSQPTSQEPIKIGFIGPLSGDAATYGELIKKATMLAVDEINSSGGVNGKEMEVIYEDGKCSGKDATSAARKLIDIDKIKVITGVTCSGELLSIAPVTEQNEVIVLSPAASSPTITNAGDFIFRNNPSDADGGRVLAGLIIQKYKKVAIISENTDYAQAFKNVFIENFKNAGGIVIADEDFIPGTKDFRSIVSKIKPLDFEALLINPQVESAAGTIMNQARELGITAPFYGNIALGGSKVLEIAGKNAEGTILTDIPGLKQDNQKAQKFLADFKEKYGPLSFEFYVGAAYDDIYILKEAISSIGMDTKKIRDYLYSLKDYKGVIGSYGFDKNGDLTGISSVVKQVVNGKLVELK